MAKGKRAAATGRRAGKGKRAAGKAPRGSIGVQIFETVERLVAEKKMSRAEAFRQVAKASGRRVGTVSVNYYRVAHQRGAKLRKRRRGRPGRPPGSKGRGRRAASGQQSAVGRALRDIAAMVGQLETELRQLHQENARFAEIRKLVGKL